MSGLFLKILNLSITASWLILAIIIIRPLMRKVPKWIVCALWAMAAFRLICPFSLESALSLIPSSETVPYDIAMKAEPAIDSGLSSVNNMINPLISDNFTPDPAASANPLQIVIPLVSLVWIFGMIVMLLYTFISYFRLKKTVQISVSVKDNILACDDVKSPFILGIVKPMIYVPSFMSGETLDCVINHEKAHIQRHDHWWKPLGFLLLTVYWFNPLCWAAFILLCRDIEMACDEKVIHDMDNNQKAAYSQALLDCNFPRRKIAACPLAFGEVGVKKRVKSVLNYKKPAFWIIVLGITVWVVVSICFLTDPIDTSQTNGNLDGENMNSTLNDVDSMSDKQASIQFDEGQKKQFARIGTFVNPVADGSEAAMSAIYSTADTDDIIVFNGKEYRKSELCNSTLSWLELSEEKRMLSSYFPPEFVENEEKWGVTLEVENVTPSGATLKCIQSGGEATGELETGSWFIIEKWSKETGWQEAPCFCEPGWTEEAWLIIKDDISDWEVDWEWLYGELPAGKYRIGKEIMDFRRTGDYDKQMYYAEFIIE